MLGARRARRIRHTLAGVLLVTVVVSGCQPARAGTRCRATDFGDDGGSWVLQCRNGRWVRALTKQQAASLLQASSASPVSPAAGSADPVAVPAANDDYPAVWRNAAQNSVFDSWGYPNRQCTSFVAWRIANVNHVALPARPGDADEWDDVLGRYLPVNSTPAVGAIAQWNANESYGGLGAGPLGHIGWVQAVHPDGTVTVEQYNLGSDGTYVQYRTRAPRYIHVRDL